MVKEEMSLSVHFKVKEMFQVPIEKVYVALLDIDAANRWMDGLVGIEWQMKGK